MCLCLLVFVCLVREIKGESSMMLVFRVQDLKPNSTVVTSPCMHLLLENERYCKLICPELSCPLSLSIAILFGSQHWLRQTHLQCLGLAERYGEKKGAS